MLNMLNVDASTSAHHLSPVRIRHVGETSRWRCGNVACCVRVTDTLTSQTPLT